MTTKENPSQHQRMVGALMGAFIGDALALGPHWFYDLNEQRQHYGDWITDYADPLPGRYHQGLKAGDSSQSGIILGLLVDSIIAQNGYLQADFCRRLDNDLLPQLDGTAMAGPGGFTSQSIRWVYRQRQRGLPWGQVASPADNTEAAERVLAIAIRYAGDLPTLATQLMANTGLTQSDPTVAAMTLAYGLVLAQLIAGEPLDATLSGKLMAKVQAGELLFHQQGDDNTAKVDPHAALKPGQLPSPDALLTVSSVAEAASQRLIEPAWKASLVYGMPCAVYHQFPAVYYLAARFQDDVESTLLHAVNGGGQNQARAILAGALSGAIGGIEAIPKRLINGLHEGERQLARANALASQV